MLKRIGLFVAEILTTAALLIAAATGALAQETVHGTLLSWSAQTGALVGTLELKAPGMAECFFELTISAGTATAQLEDRLEHRSRWKKITTPQSDVDTSSSTDQFRVHVAPVGPIRVNLTAANASTGQVDYQCVHNAIQR